RGRWSVARRQVPRHRLARRAGRLGAARRAVRRPPHRPAPARRRGRPRARRVGRDPPPVHEGVTMLRRLLAVLLSVALVGLVAPPAGADTLDDLAKRQAAAEKRKAAADSTIESL